MLARCKLNLSQCEVAERVGLSQSGYSKIERGTTAPSVRTAVRIARVVGVPVGELWPESAGSEVAQ